MTELPEDDIVERLRNEADQCANDGADDICDLLHSASDEIERLQAYDPDHNKAGGLWYRRWFKAQARVNELESLLANPPKHKFWGAGENDCPREIKATNGETHTMRCKVCGLDNPRNETCTPPADGTISTCDRLARRMGGRFVPAAHIPPSLAEAQEFFRDGGKTSQSAAQQGATKP